MFCQAHCSVVRTVTTDHNDTFDAMFLQLLDPLELAFKFGKFWVTSRTQESTTLGHDFGDISCFKLENVALYHTGIATIDTIDFHAFINGFTNNCTNSSVHSRGITTTGQDSNTFHSYFTPLFSF